MKFNEYIYQQKLKEFRRRRNIYDIPEDFHTNPKYSEFHKMNGQYRTDTQDSRFIKAISKLVASITSDILTIKYPNYANTISAIHTTIDNSIDNKQSEG